MKMFARRETLSAQRDDNVRRHHRGGRGARLALTLTLFLLLTTPAVAAPSTLFFEDFDQADGALDPQIWSDSTATISGKRLCSDEQSFAFYGHPITSNHVRVSYEFSAAGAAGFESYVILQAGSATYDAGCDGGFGDGGLCTPKIARGMDNLATATAIPMATGAEYRVQAEIDHGTVTLTIADEHGSVLGRVSLDTGEHFTELGLTVGRKADGQLTCADDFRIEDLGGDSAAHQP